MTELTVFIASISGTIVGMVLLMAFDKLRWCEMTEKRIRCPKTDKKRYINNFCLTCRHRSSRNGGKYFGTETCVLDGKIIVLSGNRCTKWEKWEI